MDREIAKRLRWLKLFKEIGNAGVVCLKCGISRPTLRKWVKRFGEHGLEGLREQSRRPHSSPKRKVFGQHEELILKLRRERLLGHRRLISELKRRHDISLSLRTVHKVLQKHGVPELGIRSIRRHVKRYSRGTPGERIQIDTLQDRDRPISVHSY